MTQSTPDAGKDPADMAQELSLIHIMCIRDRHPGQELVMMHLWELGPQRQTDLVRLMDSDAATMTRTVRRLEQAGFVRRRPSPTDKRASLIEPTAASHALRREVEQVWSRLEDLSTADLSDDERTAALHTLERLEQNLVRAATDAADTDVER